MKFSHTLSLNANPDWAKHYIDYAGLKKVINEVQAMGGPTSFASSGDYNDNASEEDDDDLEEQLKEQQRQVFLNKLTKMVSGVRQFYDKKKAELDVEMARLRPLLHKSRSRLSLASPNKENENNNNDGTTSSANETTPLVGGGGGLSGKGSSSGSLRMRSTDSLVVALQAASAGNGNKQINLEDQRREICDLFTQYHSLQQYADLNCTAVRKILKKYDKTLLDNLKHTHLESLKLLLPFWDSNTPEIQSQKDTLQKYFAHFYCNDDSMEASRQLQLMIREVITFQRHSVWLDVIQEQREKENATIESATIAAAGTDAAGGRQLRKKSSSSSPHGGRKGSTRGGGALIDVKKKKDWFSKLVTTDRFIGTLSVIIFLSILFRPSSIFSEEENNEDDDPTQRNALALFVFVSILWAAEILPLFVTSMLVPFLAVILRVIQIDGVRLDAVEASRHVFGHMFSHVIMLLLGGFSIAAALSKHNIAQIVAAAISQKCGTDIRRVVLVNMLIATGSSMWISNVAAPVLCYGLLSPILRASTAETSRAVFGTAQQQAVQNDQRLCRALVMGIALASNVGGMASPISSPQNLFAIEYTPIGWLAWFTVSIPLCLVLDLLIWGWLIYCFELPRATDSMAVKYALQRDTTRSEEPFTPDQYFVVIVSVGTVLLWCASVNLAPLTGQMGILGIVPFALFFGFGILTTQDLNSFLWSVVILAMGGLVLGEVVKTSGLLDVIAQAIATFIEDRDVSLWVTMCIFCSLILFCTTFVSHTVGAIVVVPIVQAIGSQMTPIPHDKELVFASALACSAAMGLPVSGFPNMTAVSVEDKLGNRYLATSDFLKYALPASLISLATILSLGYYLIKVAVAIDGL